MKNISPKAAVVMIGNEILSGRTQDCNFQYIAKSLMTRGIEVAEARIIADVEQEIIAVVKNLKEKYSFVFTTGGIGPTHDDITSMAIAKAFAVNYEINNDAKAILANYYANIPGGLTKARLKMAYMPAGAKLIYNEETSAPGYRIENVYVMAGVPKIMQSMMRSLQDILPLGAKILSKSLLSTIPESVLAQKFGDLQANYPQIEMGSYPFMQNGKWHTNLILKGCDSNILNNAFADLKKLINTLEQ